MTLPFSIPWWLIYVVGVIALLIGWDLWKYPKYEMDRIVGLFIGGVGSIMIIYGPSMGYLP